MKLLLLPYLLWPKRFLKNKEMPVLYIDLTLRWFRNRHKWKQKNKGGIRDENNPDLDTEYRRRAGAELCPGRSYGGSDGVTCTFAANVVSGTGAGEYGNPCLKALGTN